MRQTLARLHPANRFQTVQNHDLLQHPDGVYQGGDLRGLLEHLLQVLLVEGAEHGLRRADGRGGALFKDDVPRADNIAGIVELQDLAAAIAEDLIGIGAALADDEQAAQLLAGAANHLVRLEGAGAFLQP